MPDATHPPDPQDASRLLTTLRRTHDSSRPACPHCRCPRVHRWGSFSGRQRYRCTGGCGRTFSDFTRLPFAYSKKPGLWIGFERGMWRRESIRAAAARLGIHPCTAFRWRHRILAWSLEHDRQRLSGRIELTIERFSESRKGDRALGRPARRRAQGPWAFMTSMRVPVVFAWVDDARWISLVAGARRERPDVRTRPTMPPLVRRWPAADVLHEGLDPRIQRSASTRLLTFLNPRSTPVGRLAELLDLPLVIARRNADASTATETMRGVHGLPVLLRRWLSRFRGVASRYLDHYLIWHRRTECTIHELPTLPANRTDQARCRSTSGSLLEPMQVAHEFATPRSPPRS
jgi:transposase-like protein